MGEQYCLIGPLLDDRLPAEFEEATDPDPNDPYTKAVDKLRADGWKFSSADGLLRVLRKLYSCVRNRPTIK